MNITVEKIERTVKVNVITKNVIVSKPENNIVVNRVGRRGEKGEQGAQGPKGDKGDPATNLVTSVNGKQGVVVLNSSDVGADPSGAAAQALNDAKAYTDQEVGDIDTGVLSVTAGTNVTVDNTDPKNPIVSASGGGGGAVDSVNGKTGVVVLNKSDIGLGNVDNTSDANKPVSTATQTALNGKENSFTKGNLVAGTNVTLSGTLTNRLVGSGNVTINAAGGVSSVDWGDINGTLSDQTDLQNALDDKADTSSLATVATSGSYDDLTDKPTIGTGDVVGPTTATENALVRYDGTTGKLIKNSSATLDDSGLLTLPGASISYLAVDSAEIPLISGDMDFGASGSITGTQEFATLDFSGYQSRLTYDGTYTPSLYLKDVSSSNISILQPGSLSAIRTHVLQDKDGTLAHTSDIPTTISDLSGDSDDISEGSTNLYLTSAERTKLSNTSGTNTGDQTLSGLGGVPTSRTINGQDLSANRTLTQDNIGDGTTYKQFSQTEKSKLAGIEANADVTDSTNVQASLPSGTNGQVLKHNGTSWAAGTDNNTTYSVPSQAEAEAGTATTGRTFTAQRVNQAIQALAPVKSVNTKTGAVVLNADEIDFLSAPGTSIEDGFVGLSTSMTQKGVLAYDVFTSNGTWTKPTGAKVVEVFAIGGGGGGGKGRSAAEGNLRHGGGGGGTGGAVIGQFDAIGLTSTVAVTVGTGGAGATTDGPFDGGGSGGASSFGSYVQAGGGNGGACGSGFLGAGGGTAGASSLVAAGGGTGDFSGLGFQAPGNSGHMGSGAGGAARNAANTTSPALGGGNSSAGAGGTAGGAASAGGNGANGSGTNGGAGGGGGGIGQVGGNGGTNGGGGGGGGAAIAPAASGNGGAGGNGIVIVITYG